MGWLEGGGGGTGGDGEDFGAEEAEEVNFALGLWGVLVRRLEEGSGVARPGECTCVSGMYITSL